MPAYRRLRLAISPDQRVRYDADFMVTVLMSSGCYSVYVRHRWVV